MKAPEGFVVHPTPSPTSKLGLNLRYYVFEHASPGQSVYWDIGPMQEMLMESIKGNMIPMPDAEFEKITRAAMQEQLRNFIEFVPNHMLFSMTHVDEATMERLRTAVVQESRYMQHVLTEELKELTREHSEKTTNVSKFFTP
jgi:hypothetical protein